MIRSLATTRAPRLRLATLALWLSAAELAGTGCDSRSPGFFPNQPPTVTLTSGPVDTVSAPQSWLVEIAWTASDPDGHVDYFEYATDPPSLKRALMAAADTDWVRTRERSATIRFRASRPDSLGWGATASESHVFVLRAVDDDGGVSPLLVRAFYATTVAPNVEILSPEPHVFLAAQVPVPFRVSWAGHDPDGAGAQRPIAYRTRLLDLDDPRNQIFRMDPDSLLRLGFASNWADWRVLGADTTSQMLTSLDGLSPTRSGLFAVVAVDEAGATTPYALLDRNLLQFVVMLGTSHGPRIHVWSALVDYTYASGGYENTPEREIPVEVSSRSSPEFRWDGIAAPGREVASSRWNLDGDPFGDTPERGWSPLGPPSDAIRLSFLPFLGPGVHRLYIELRDDVGDRSLAIVRLEVFEPSFTDELLVVDDTRREPDKFVNDPTRQTPDLYTRTWPSAAELDTFLYARGGFPWRGARNPADALSMPGLLAGFAFDTLGTQRGLEDASQATPLSTLSRYRHVLWLVEPSFAGPIPVAPTALRAMSAPGVASELAAYVQAGGRVWLAGGGGAYESLINFNVTDNDDVGVVFARVAGELGPGRPLYEHAHLRSVIEVRRTGAEPRRSAAAVGGWSRRGPGGELSAPDYSRLPQSLRFRTPATDPIPPTRPAGQGSLFYTSQSSTEYLSAPNSIVVEQGSGPSASLVSVLDTLYEVSSPTLPLDPAPVMFYYHGPENAPFVFSGFDLWSWSRSDCQALVTFVLGDIWGLTPSSPAVRPGTAAEVRPIARSPRARVLDPVARRP